MEIREMFLPCLKSAARCAALIALTFTFTLTVWGQASDSGSQALPETPQKAAPVSSPQPQRFEMKNYTKPYGYFPNPLAPYQAHSIPQPNLSNTPRIMDLMRNGVIYLSIDDAVALALENNLDLAIARYNLNIADTDIMRTAAGSSVLGVPNGLIEGTPGATPGGLGGTIGSGVGGTNPSAGTAGVGGLSQSTEGLGPNVPSFDPVITGTLQADRSQSLSTSAFSGVPITRQNTNTWDFAYTQGFHWGTNLQVGFNNTRTTSNSPFNSLSPTLNSNFRFELTQPLLQGFGFAPTTRFIKIAKNNRESTDVAFRLQVLTTVDQIEGMYWNLVYAYEYLRVQQEAVAFAQKTLSDTQKQVQIGTLAPIEVVRAQSTVASDQQTLTTAKNNLDLQELLMKNALSRTMSNPALASARVVPTSTVELPKNETLPPVEDLINDALSHRAELAEQRIDLRNRQISSQAIKNLLRPSLNLFAYYGGTGVGGSLSPTANICTPNSTAFCVNPATVPTNGYGGTLNQLVDSTAPDKGIGIQLNIPIRNRTAQSEQIRSGLEYRQAQMRLQQLENQVRIEVRNALFTLQQNESAVQSAQAAVDLAQQSLDAEQKKLALGASTSTLVLQNQSALASAESTLVSAKADYEKSRLEMDRATGLLLEHNGIIISDAEQGQVTHMPTVPYVAPRPPETIPSIAPTQATPAPAAPSTQQ